MTFIVLIYFVNANDIIRRSIIRKYIHQNMVVDKHIINYVFAVAADDNETERLQNLNIENRKYNDIIISVHKDNMANVTLTILDAMLWARDNCKYTKFVGRIDGDVWLHLGNLVRYLQTVPSKSYYGGYTIHYTIRRRTKKKTRFYFPSDYPYIYSIAYQAGGAYFLSQDVVPYINIGALFYDIIVHAGEDYMIGDILSRANIKPYPKPKNYILYTDIGWIGKPLNEWPKNLIVVHKVKKIDIFKKVYDFFNSTYTIPY